MIRQALQDLGFLSIMMKKNESPLPVKWYRECDRPTERGGSRMPFYIVREKIQIMDVDVILLPSSYTKQIQDTDEDLKGQNANPDKIKMPAVMSPEDLQTGRYSGKPGPQKTRKQLKQLLKTSLKQGFKSAAIPVAKMGTLADTDGPWFDLIPVFEAVEFFLKKYEMEIYLVNHSIDPLLGDGLLARDLEKFLKFHLDHTAGVALPAPESETSGFLEFEAPALTGFDFGIPEQSEDFTTDLFEESSDELIRPEAAEYAVLSQPRLRKTDYKMSLEEMLEEMDEPFSECLFMLIDEKGKTDVEVYKKANLDRRLFSKIRTIPGYTPKKTTVLELSAALELTLEETDLLLKRAGYAFSPSSPADVIVQFFFLNGIYDLFTINAALFDYDQPLLGG